MPLTRGGGDDDATDLGEVVVSSFRKFVTDLPFYAQGVEPDLELPPEDPDGGPPPPPPTPREQALRDILEALRAAAEEGRQVELTDAQRDLMQQYNIGLHELLAPGIYQFEFSVAGVGEHRQWVRVTDTGSEIISGNRTQDTLTVFMNQSYESNTNHGRDSDTGTHRIYAVQGTYNTDPAVIEARWSAMEAAAAAIINQGLNYHVLQQNSNSVFFTVGRGAGMEGVDTGWAPADDVDLTTRNLTNQPDALSVDDFHIWIGGSDSDSRTGDSNGPNLLDGGSGHDTITGGSMWDALYGGDGNDIISSLGGIVEGGAGNDQLSAASGSASLLTGDAGDDTITGSAGEDLVDGGDGNDTIHAGAGDDRIWGGLGVDVLYGDDGYDTIAAGDGDDFVYGGAGNDILSGNGGSDYIDGGDGDDAIYGGRDASRPDGVPETLHGGAGNDVIYGSQAADTIYGGAGDDLIFGDIGGDHLWGGTGADRFKFRIPPDSTSASPNPLLAIDVIHDFETGVDKLDLSELDIVLWSPSRIDTIHWWTANGSMFVGWDMNSGGIDLMTVELVGVTSFSWNDLLLPKEDLVLVGGNFADNLRGMDGNDTLRGRGGADTLNGGTGTDTADYALATSAVTARLDLMQATNDGSGSADTLVSIENLTGSAYNDLLFGNGGANVLSGGAGYDTLLGLAGNDILIGGPGVANQLQGGLGDDIYVIEANDTVVEAAGEGTDTVQTVRTSYTLGNNVENLTYTGASAFAGTGNSLANVMTGGGAADTLSGGGGDDILTGGLGNDALHGGAGSDTVVLAGLQADYAFSVVSGGHRVTDSEAGRDGVDTLTGIEFIRFGDGSTVLLSSLVASGAPALSGKDLEDDPFILPGDPDAFVLSKSFDHPLVLPGEQDLALDVGLTPVGYRFTGAIQHLVDDGGLDLPGGAADLWQIARGEFDLFV